MSVIEELFVWKEVTLFMYNKCLATLVQCFENGNKLILAGNGGSFSDAHHIMGELRKGFHLKRPLPAELREKLQKLGGQDGEILANTLQQGLPVIALGCDALGTAIVNDLGGEFLYAQQLMGMIDGGDVFFAISTSGNARNLILAAITAKALGATVIALTGKNGGKLKAIADITVTVECEETYLVQEEHIKLYHKLCAELESRFFGRDGN